MSTEEERCLAIEANTEIEMCCRTVADMEPVYEYIKHLEQRIKELEEGS